MHIHSMSRLVGATIAIGLIQIMLASPALAAAGDLDTTFSGDGRVTTGFAGGADASGVVVQADGKIVAAGAVDRATSDSRFALTRYRPNGTLDPTFSGDGKVITPFAGGPAEAFDLALQQDGKIVAVGDAGQGFALARYNTDGTLDPSFGGDGKVTTGLAGGIAMAVAIQADGKVVAAGQTRPASGDFLFALARYRPNGTLDTTFSGDGKVTTAFPGGIAFALDVALQQDGGIVAAGGATDATTLRSTFALARYRSGGALDPTFSGDGKVITDFPGELAQASGVALQQDGKIVAAGDARPGPSDFLFAVARYLPDGTLDPNFSGDGKATTGFGAETTSGALDVGIQADGNIVAAGASLPTSTQARFALTRYRPNGSLDPAFGGDGRVTTVFPGDFAEASAVAIQGGRIVAAGFAFLSGTSRFALARYLGS